MKTFTKAQLDAARVRLDVAQGITEEVVETATRAMWDEIAAGFTGNTSWSEALESTKAIYRNMARAALRAVLPVAPVHRCDTCACSRVCVFARRFEEPFAEEPIARVKGVIVECSEWRDRNAQAVSCAPESVAEKGGMVT